MTIAIRARSLSHADSTRTFTLRGAYDANDASALVYCMLITIYCRMDGEYILCSTDTVMAEFVTAGIDYRGSP